jgi:hypothetical protein
MHSSTSCKKESLASRKVAVVTASSSSIGALLVSFHEATIRGTVVTVVDVMVMVVAAVERVLRVAQVTYAIRFTATKRVD